MRRSHFPAMLALAVAAGLATGGVVGAAEISGTVEHRIDVGLPEVVERDGGHRVRVEGFGLVGELGKPMVPGKIFAVAIPPDARFVSLRVETGEPVQLAGTYAVAPAPLSRMIGGEDPEVVRDQRELWQISYDATYGSDHAYPARPATVVRSAGFRRYNLVDVRVTPVRYRPLSGRLEYVPSVTVFVDYTLMPAPPPPLEDHVQERERIAREIVCNYDQAQEWYPEPPPTESRGTHEFVIVTTQILEQWVAPLVNHEGWKGRTPRVVTVQWIDANYAGYDRAARIRSFLRDKYPSSAWGIRDVLLVGPLNQVPMRECCVDLGYGRPHTDFYYAELSEPDETSWDLNGNHCYGEEGVDTVDMYTEVNVGRIPWNHVGIVLDICRKSVAYERNDDPSFKKNILVAGAFFWADTDTAVLMEAKLARPWMADWTVTRLYENNADFQSPYAHDFPLNHANMVGTWSSGRYAFVNWAGHGSPSSAHLLGMAGSAFIESTDCALLDDGYPSIVWADSCSNNNPAFANMGREMLRQGAVGFVGSTQVAGGRAAWQDPSDGSSQSCDYWFTNQVTSGAMTQGEAHQWALRKLYTDGLWSWVYYEMFEWTLLGNPNLSMRKPEYPGAIFIDGFETSDPSAWTFAMGK